MSGWVHPSTCRCCRSPIIRRRPSQVRIRFEALSRGPHAPCVRFAAGDCSLVTQHSVPTGCQPLPGRVGYLPGPVRRFQFITSSFAKLCLAHIIAESSMGTSMKARGGKRGIVCVSAKSASAKVNAMRNRREPKQLSLCLRTWGGRRAGAGRKRRPGRVSCVPHVRRQPHQDRYPVHVTLRASRRVPSLRRMLGLCRQSIRRAMKAGFRITDWSVQSDHLHLIVEGDDDRALSRGIQGLAIRLARAINTCLGRKGRVWADRNHRRELRSPREVRNVLVYVLFNSAKRGHSLTAGTDPYSSAPWFDGFLEPAPEGASPPFEEVCPVAEPRTWLRAKGWMRSGGLVSRSERPRCS